MDKNLLFYQNTPTPPWFFGSCLKNGVPPRHMTEHWLEFQNGPARRSRVIMRKQLKYYQIRQFALLGPPGGRCRWGSKSKKQRMELLTQGTFLPSL